MLAQEGWIQEGVRRTRVDQRLDGNRRLAGHEYVDQQGDMARDGVGERKRKRKRKGASQCYDAIREDIIALGQAYTLEHITWMKEGRMVICESGIH